MDRTSPNRQDIVCKVGHCLLYRASLVGQETPSWTEHSLIDRTGQRLLYRTSRHEQDNLCSTLRRTSSVRQDISCWTGHPILDTPSWTGHLILHWTFPREQDTPIWTGLYLLDGALSGVDKTSVSVGQNTPCRRERPLVNRIFLVR